MKIPLLIFHLLSLMPKQPVLMPELLLTSQKLLILPHFLKILYLILLSLLLMRPLLMDRLPMELSQLLMSLPQLMPLLLNPPMKLPIRSPMLLLLMENQGLRCLKPQPIERDPTPLWGQNIWREKHGF